jgi:outer membrane protein OmpA-like peptidoglycan-associated protein
MTAIIIAATIMTIDALAHLSRETAHHRSLNFKASSMKKLLILAGLSMAVLAACTTNPYTGQQSLSKTAMGAGLGAAVGAGTGTLFGGNDLKNAGWGALAGGLAGAAIGAYMDHQEQAMRQSLEGTGIEVQRTAENTVNLTMPSNITFAYNSADLTPQVQTALDSVARILNQYPATTINVTGHTDDIGSDNFNQTLSERRAASVATYLGSHGVNPARVSQQGMGERMPKVANVDEASRSQNRRVELAIKANEAAGAPTQPGAAPTGTYPPPQGTYPQQGNSPPAGGYPSQPQTNYPAQPGAYPQTSPYPAQGGYPQPITNPAPSGYPPAGSPYTYPR